MRAIDAHASPAPDPVVAPFAKPPAEKPIAPEDGPPENNETAPAMLVRLAGEARIFRGLDNRFYADVPTEGHHEIHELGSPAFEYWLIRRIRGERKSLPSLEGLKRLIRTLEADAIAQGTPEPVWVRVAAGNCESGTPHDAANSDRSEPPSKNDRTTLSTHHSPLTTHQTAYFVDLGDSRREAVEIRAEGCRIVARPPVLFVRPPGVLALPRPCWEDSSIGLLKRYINVADADFPLVIAWATAAMRPIGPYPILVITGEQGTAKSHMGRFLRSLIDPSSALLRTLPGSQRDLMIEAQNSWVLAYDNVSAISAAQSDCLCQISTGGGFSTRTLFTDKENTLFDVQRPIILIGINDFVRRSDLIDRCIFLHAPAIPDELRRLGLALSTEFEAEYPRLLGAMLGAVSTGMRLAPTIEITALPRMADFAHWGEAVCRGLGYEPGSFMSLYNANRREACWTALGDCPVAEALRELLDYFGRPMEETASELLALLAGCVPHRIRNTAEWPKNARALSALLRRIAPQLRMTGIIVRLGLGSRERLISVSAEIFEAGAGDTGAGQRHPANPGNNA
jgi:hypothetical protein